MFNTKFNRCKYRSSNVGSQFANTYEYRVIDGIKLLVPCGETDIDSFIQSFKEESDIHNIISRYLNGEVDILNKFSSEYADFTHIPDNYAELFDRVQRCKNAFDVLPVELKEMFDNSYESFWSEFGTDKFNGKIAEFNNLNNPDILVNSQNENIGDVKNAE